MNSTMIVISPCHYASTLEIFAEYMNLVQHPETNQFV